MLCNAHQNSRDENAGHHERKDDAAGVVVGFEAPDACIGQGREKPRQYPHHMQIAPFHPAEQGHSGEPDEDGDDGRGTEPFLQKKKGEDGGEDRFGLGIDDGAGEGCGADGIEECEQGDGPDDPSENEGKGTSPLALYWKAPYTQSNDGKTDKIAPECHFHRSHRSGEELGEGNREGKQE